MNRALVWIACLVSTWMIGAAAPAHACKCAPRTLAEAVGTSDVVAIVDVGEVRTEKQGARSASVTFHEVLRGPLGTARLWWTPPDGKSCDLVELKPGRWLLFASWGADGRLVAGRCDTNTEPVKRAVVKKKKAELMALLKPIRSEAEAIAAARAAVNPMLIASMASAPGGGLSGVHAGTELSPPDRAAVTREADGAWLVRWAHHPPAGNTVDAEVRVRADGSVQVVRASASFSPD